MTAALLRPLHSLRPYGFAVVWLLLFEALLRLKYPPDARVLHAPLPVYGCMADDELERLMAARESPSPAGTLDVVLVGDSVLGSVNNPPGDRLGDALGPALAAQLVPSGSHAVRVFDLSAGGARAADVYGALRRLRRRLDESRQGTQNLLVVVSSNVIFFSRRQSQPPMLFPCLLDAIPDVEWLRQRLSLPAPPRPAETRLALWLAKHVYLFQQRRQLAETLFGGPPRQALRERLQKLHRPADAPAPAGNRVSGQQDYAQYAPNYDFIPLSSPEALNYVATQELASFIGEQKDLPVLVVMTPHNHARLGAMTDTDAYRSLSAAIAAVFLQKGVPFVSYDRTPAIDSSMFLDLDHLTAAGNRALALLLSGDLARLQAVDSSRRAVR